MIIISDDHACQTISVYNGIGQTPNIDRMAKTGATFHAYLNNSIYGPARATLLTGKYSHRVVLQDPTRPHHETLYYHYHENGEHAVSPHFGVSDGRYKLICFYKRVEGWELYGLKKRPSGNEKYICG